MIQTKFIRNYATIGTGRPSLEMANEELFSCYQLGDQDISFRI